VSFFFASSIQTLFFTISSSERRGKSQKNRPSISGLGLTLELAGEFLKRLGSGLGLQKGKFEVLPAWERGSGSFSPGIIGFSGLVSGFSMGFP
jgi:hypothetical protein